VSILPFRSGVSLWKNRNGKTALLLSPFLLSRSKLYIVPYLAATEKTERKEFMQIVAVANHKGGVGKTTSAVNIAACWGEMGQTVLLVDLDPQGSASISFGVENDGNGILQALQKTISLPVVCNASIW
jgi:Mrp family chromosome partitioning ATPase